MLAWKLQATSRPSQIHWWCIPWSLHLETLQILHLNKLWIQIPLRLFKSWKKPYTQPKRFTTTKTLRPAQNLRLATMGTLSTVQKMRISRPHNGQQPNTVAEALAVHESASFMKQCKWFSSSMQSILDWLRIIHYLWNFSRSKDMQWEHQKEFQGPKIITSRPIYRS